MGTRTNGIFRDSESWTLADGATDLEPYSVGTTHIVDALELREEGPQLWCPPLPPAAGTVVY